MCCNEFLAWRASLALQVQFLAGLCFVALCMHPVPVPVLVPICSICGIAADRAYAVGHAQGLCGAMGKHGGAAVGALAI